MGEEIFSRINSHVIDVLEVARRRDETGLMMRGWTRGPWLSETTETEDRETERDRERESEGR